MPWMDWIALKHSAFVHLPIAAAILLPIALVAAQRPGRGIKPWWITCRYLTWAGILSSFPAVLTGLRDAYGARYLAQGQLLSTGTLGNPTLFQLHQWLAGGSLILGILTLRSLYRHREEHQGIGPLGLFWGLLWCAALLSGAFFGTRLAHPRAEAPAPVAVEVPKAPVAAPAAPKAPVVPVDSEAPWRLLNYASLAPTQAEPVKSAPHGNRWIRVWVDPKAMDAYQG